MPTGYSTTSAVADSLPDMRMSAIIVREYPNNTMLGLVDRVTLGVGVGLSWNEVSYDQLTAQDVTETTKLDNPAQMSDSLLTITPTVTGIHYILTDRVKVRIFSAGLAKMSQLGQNAIERKKDEDLIAQMDGFTTQLAGTGTTLTSGYIHAAKSRITGNTTESAVGPFYTVLHPYGVKDLLDELVAGVGTYIMGPGRTAETYSAGFSGMLGGTMVHEDGNIPIDATPDAKGGVFAKAAIVHVQGRAARMVSVRDESIGGGADVIYHYDEYASGERSSGNWGYEIMHNATAPTS